MCDCIPSIPISLPVTKFRGLASNRFNPKTPCEANPGFYPPNGSKLTYAGKSDCPGAKSDRSLFLCVRASKSTGLFGSEDCGFRSELGFKEKGDHRFDFDTNRSQTKKNRIRKERESSMGSEFLELRGGGAAEEEREGGRRPKESLEQENLVKVEERGDGDGDGGGDGEEALVQESGSVGLRKGRQVLRRSTMLAKQVISIRSALSLGFVSQLWVDTTSVSCNPSQCIGKMRASY